MSKFKPEVGQLVVVSHDLGATMYRVRKIEGFNVGVVDTALEDIGAIQWHDRSIFKGPSIGQLKQHTAKSA